MPRRPLTSRASTVGNIEQAIPNLSTVHHELNTGFPFKPVLNGLEDIAMKEN